MWKKYILCFRCPPLSTSHWLESWVFYDVDHWEEFQLKDSHHQGPGNNEQFNGCEIYLTLLVKSRTQKLFSLLTCTVGIPFGRLLSELEPVKRVKEYNCSFCYMKLTNTNIIQIWVHIRELIGNQSNQCWSNRRTRHTTGWWGFVRFTDSDFMADKI